MAVVRCDKGHYYDDEKFTQCPHCGVLPVMQPEKPVKPKRFNLFHKDKDRAGRQSGAGMTPGQAPVPPVPPQTPPVYDDRTVGISAPMAEMDDNRTVAYSNTSASSYAEDDNRTIAFSHTSPSPYAEDDNRTIAFSHTSPSPIAEDDNRTIAFSHTSPSPIAEDDNRTIAFSHTSMSPIAEDDNRTVAYSHTSPSPIAEDDNRTVAYSHTSPSPIEEDDNRTAPFTAVEGLEDTMPVAEEPQAAGESEQKVQEEPEQDERGTAVQEAAGREAAASEADIPEPAVEQKKTAAAARIVQPPEGRFAAGWLVCVKGAERGIDFRLYKGFNRIGTSSQADIVLAEGDAEEILCAVVYDDRGNQFYAVQQSEAPAYLNGEVIQGAVALHAGDILCAGTSEFEFIPFCREGRSWDMDEPQ